jgi:hypothetical protein
MELDSIQFEVGTKAPSLDLYRRGWVPASGTGLAGMWFGGVVTDGSGQNYWGIRGADDFITGMTHVVTPICGFRALQDGLDTDPPHLFDEYSTIDWYEPMQYTEDENTARLAYPSGSIERTADGVRWSDASGRWTISGRTVSDVFVVHVPAQEGIPDDVYYRHELLRVDGKINGTEVSGFVHQDFAYGPPGMAYAELPIARQLQGMWVSWLHEFSDGEIGGGCFWQGRGGLTFGPGYQLVDGVTTAHDDIVATPMFNSDGKLAALDATVGTHEYHFDFNSSGSLLHVFGPLTRSSRGKPITNSWCWVEYAGDMMTPEILDMMMQTFQLARS